jgi:hypothetical protein
MGLAQLGLIVKLMEEAIPKIGATSEAGKDLLQALTRISKHIPPGTVSPASENNQLESLRMKQAQAGPQIAAMRAPGAGAGAPPPMPAAAAA